MHPIAARRPRSRGLTCLFVQGLALAAGLAVSRVPAFAQGDVFSSGSPSTPYGAGNTTRRTGKQAVQDDSVYCQQMPDGRVIPQPYGGTRRNIPCGPNFVQRPPAVNRADECLTLAGTFPSRQGVRNAAVHRIAGMQPVSLESVRANGQGAAPGFLVPVANKGTPRLIIKGLPMAETDKNFGCYIKHLIVAPEVKKSRKLEFDSANTKAAVEKIQDPLRRQIFDAMNHTTAMPFVFMTMDEAIKNFNLRVAAIRYMRGIEDRFAYYDPLHPMYIYSKHWTAQDYPAGAGGKVFHTVEGSGAYESIRDLERPRDGLLVGAWDRHHRADCLTSVQMAIFSGVASAVSRVEFDAVHPKGLLFLGLPDEGLNATPRYRSILENIERLSFGGRTIRISDMVPGDWVYMRNDPRYRTLRPKGYANGENALYMGRFAYSGSGAGAYSGDAAPRFSGLGVTSVSEAELKARVSEWFREHTGQSADEREIRWAAVNRPVARRSGLWASK